ncbi:MAG: hypothetical protein PVF51_01020 [Nitrospirota bacterium]|jgi:hypothetical protein
MTADGNPRERPAPAGSEFRRKLSPRGVVRGFCLYDPAVIEPPFPDGSSPDPETLRKAALRGELVLKPLKPAADPGTITGVHHNPTHEPIEASGADD